MAVIYGESNEHKPNKTFGILTTMNQSGQFAYLGLFNEVGLLFLFESYFPVQWIAAEITSINNRVQFREYRAFCGRGKAALCQ